MNIFFEVVIAIAIFIGIFLLLGAIGSVLPAIFVTLLKIVLGVAAVIWLVRLAQRLWGANGPSL